MANSSFEDSIKVLILIGALDEDCKVTSIVTSVKYGLKKWSEDLDIDLISSLDECVEKFPDQYKASIQSEALAPLTKFTCVRNKVSLLVLVNPTCVMVNKSIAQLMVSQCSKCLVVYGGHFVDSQPNWVFQDGVYAIEDLEYLLIDKEITSTLVSQNIHSKISVSCCEASKWKVVKQDVPRIEIEFIDPFSPSGNESPSATLEHLDKFIDFLEDALKKQVKGIFSQLSPPKHKSFLRTHRPSIYIFPAGNGDSAFFKVDCFNILINGGALTRPWFWHLVRHEYRVDCVIATHLNADSLSGLNSFFLRKLHEQKLKFPKDQESEEFRYLSKFLLSPDLGHVFINPPHKFLESSLRKSSDTSSVEQPGSGDVSVAQQLDIKTADVVRETFRLLKGLQIEPQPLTRKGSPEPITLLYKLGVGKLQLYPINPDEDSKELEYVRQKWGSSTKATGKSGVKLPSGDEGHSLVSDLSSVCCLLVWFPASPKERIIRVLFPGNAPESRVFDGMERLKLCKFLNSASPTAFSMEGRRPNSTRTSRASTFKARSAVGLKPPIRSSVASARSSSAQNNKTTAGAKTGAASKQTPAKPTVKSAIGTRPVPLLSKISAPKKPAVGVAKKPPTARLDTATVKPDQQRSKAEKPGSPRAQPAKAKSPAKPDAKAKPKAASGKTSSPGAKRSGAKPQAKSANVLGVKPKKLTSKSPSKIQSKAVVPGDDASPKAPKKADDAPQDVTSVHTVTSALKELVLSVPEDRDAAELLKARPSPEGQDHSDQEKLEVVKELSGSIKSDQVQEESEKPATDPSPPSNYFTVSPKTSDIDSVKASVLVSDNQPQDEVSVKSETSTASLEPVKEMMKEAVIESTGEVMKSDDYLVGELDEQDDYDEDKTLVVCDLDEKLDVNEKEMVESEEASSGPTEDPSLSKEVVSTNVIESTEDDAPIEESSPDPSGCDEAIASPDATQILSDYKTTEELSCSEVDVVEVGKAEEDHSIEEDVLVNEKANEKQEIDESIEVGRSDPLDDFKLVSNEFTKVNADALFDGTEAVDEESLGCGDQSEIAETPLSDSHFRISETGSISDTKQGYLEIEESSLKKETKMSCTPPSSGPSISTENNDESDSSAPPGIVEFHHLDNQKERPCLANTPSEVEDDSDRGEQTRQVDAVSEDADADLAMTCSKAEMLAVDAQLYGDVNQNEATCDRFDDYYDDNGNKRTASAYKQEFIADQSRADAIFLWPESPPTKDASCDMFKDVLTLSVDNLPSPNSMIVSFQNEEIASCDQGSNTEDADATLSLAPVDLSEEFPVAPSAVYSDPREDDSISENLVSPSEQIPVDTFKENRDCLSENDCIDPAEEVVAGPCHEIVAKSIEDVAIDFCREALTYSSEQVFADPPQNAGYTPKDVVNKSPADFFADLSKEVAVGSSVDQSVDDFSFRRMRESCDVSPPSDLMTKSTKEDLSCYNEKASEIEELSTCGKQQETDLKLSADPETEDKDQQSSEVRSDLVGSCVDSLIPDPITFSRLSSHSNIPSDEVCEDEDPSTPSYALKSGHDEEQKNTFPDNRSDNAMDRCVSFVDDDVVIADNVSNDVRNYDLDDTKYRLVHGSPMHESATKGDLSPANLSESKDLSSGIASAISEFDHDLGQLHADQIDPSKNEEFGVISFSNPLDFTKEQSFHGKLKPEATENVPSLAEKDLKSGEFAEQGILLDSKVLETKYDVAADTADVARKSLGAAMQETGPDAPVCFNANNPFIEDILLNSPSGEACFAPQRQDDPAMAPERAPSGKPRKSTPGTTGSRKDHPVFYVDLAYVPHHANKNHCGVEFFKRIRSHYYVLSGFDASNHEPSAETLDALLEGKKTWGKTPPQDHPTVSVIPTHNSSALFNWFEKNNQDLVAEDIHMVAFGSKVQMHDEEIDACKIEL